MGQVMSKCGGKKKPVSTGPTLGEKDIKDGPEVYVPRQSFVSPPENVEDLIQDVSAHSRWEFFEVRYLLAKFRSLNEGADQYLLTEDQFKKTLSTLGQSLFLDFDGFSESSSDSYQKWLKRAVTIAKRDTTTKEGISFPMFAVFLEVACKGKRKEQLDMIFNLFDLDNDGYWNDSEFNLFLRCCIHESLQLDSTVDSIPEIPEDADSSDASPKRNNLSVFDRELLWEVLNQRPVEDKSGVGSTPASPRPASEKTNGDGESTTDAIGEGGGVSADSETGLGTTSGRVAEEMDMEKIPLKSDSDVGGSSDLNEMGGAFSTDIGETLRSETGDESGVLGANDSTAADSGDAAALSGGASGDGTETGSEQAAASTPADGAGERAAAASSALADCLSGVSKESFDEMSDLKLWILVLSFIRETMRMGKSKVSREDLILLAPCLHCELLLSSFNLIPSRKEERMRIKELSMSTARELGQKWYILSQEWWESWTMYVGYDLSYEEAAAEDAALEKAKRTGIPTMTSTLHKNLRPLKIQNANLLDPDSHFTVLRKDTAESRDFQIIPESVWKQLVDWYGGGPEISRTVVSVDSEVRMKLLSFELKKRMVQWKDFHTEKQVQRKVQKEAHAKAVKKAPKRNNNYNRGYNNRGRKGGYRPYSNPAPPREPSLSKSGSVNFLEILPEEVKSEWNLEEIEKEEKAFLAEQSMLANPDTLRIDLNPVFLSVSRLNSEGVITQGYRSTTVENVCISCYSSIAEFYLVCLSCVGLNLTTEEVLKYKQKYRVYFERMFAEFLQSKGKSLPDSLKESLSVTIDPKELPPRLWFVDESRNMPKQVIYPRFPRGVSKLAKTGTQKSSEDGGAKSADQQEEEEEAEPAEASAAKQEEMDGAADAAPPPPADDDDADADADGAATADGATATDTPPSDGDAAGSSDAASTAKSTETTTETEEDDKDETRFEESSIRELGIQSGMLFSVELPRDLEAEAAKKKKAEEEAAKLKAKQAKQSSKRGGKKGQPKQQQQQATAEEVSKEAQSDSAPKMSESLYVLQCKEEEDLLFVTIDEQWIMDNVKVGFVLDCKDSHGKWYESTIREVKPKGVEQTNDRRMQPRDADRVKEQLGILVNFKGWKEKWNEWIYITEDCLCNSKRLTRNKVHCIALAQTQSRLQKEAMMPKGGASSSSSGGYGRFAPKMLRRGTVRGAPTTEGVVGLTNLGNTCFMNSIIQCISNTPHLRTYFTSGVYKGDINKDNPLGQQGKLADAFAALLVSIWSGKYQVVAPRDFKSALSKFAPMFSGWQQHDSQEFLGYVLDGLHEDLNLVKEKPYTEKIEADGRPDSVVAELSWKIHLMRNRSKIVDLFQAQYKSYVNCPDCPRISITFESYMFLSVPLVGSMTKNLIVDVFHMGHVNQKKKGDPTTDSGSPSISSLPMRHKFTMNKLQKIRDIVGQLSEMYNCKEDFILIYTSFNNRLRQRELDRNLGLGTLMDDQELQCFLMRDWNATYTLDEIKKLKIGLEVTRCSWVKPLNCAKEETEKDEARRAKYILAPEKTVDSEGDGGTQDTGGAEEDGQEATGDGAPNKPTEAPPKRKFKRWDGKSNADYGLPFAIGLLNLHSFMDVYKCVYQRIEQWVPKAIERHCREIGVTPKRVGLHSTVAIQPPSQQTAGDDAKIEEPPEPTIHEFYTVELIDFSDEDWIKVLSTCPFKIRLLPMGHFHYTTKYHPPEWLDPLDNETLFGRYIKKKKSRHQDNDISIEWRPEYYYGMTDPNAERVTELEVATVLNQVAIHETYKAYKKERDLKKKAFAESGRVSNMTLYDCLHQYVRKEVLDKDEMWYCSECRDFKQAVKKLDLWSFPEILIIHLKRFQVLSRSGRGEKINTFVDYPIRGLDLSPFVIDDNLQSKPLYDLYAVSCHSGSTGGGHYTAYGLNSKSDRWYYFNDSMVRPAKISDVVTQSAYVLFYKKVH